jgi:nucleoside-diphosphate-sugar epimerase
MSSGNWGRLWRLFTQLYGLETVALRYFNVFGPRQNPASEYAAVIPRFLTALTEGRRPTVFGDGEQTRDFVYIEDVVKANLLAAETQAAVGQVINIGSGERISLNAILRLAGALLGMTVEAEYREARRRCARQPR